MLQATATPNIPAPPGQPGGLLSPSQVTIDGNAISTAQAVYQGFRAQRRELQRQLDDLESSRRSISERLTNQTLTQADRTGLEQRLAAIDERVISLDKQIAEAEANVARSAAMPGAAIELPQPRRSGPPEEAFVLGGMLIFFGVFPLAIAYARRIWKRSTKVIMDFPQDLADRLGRLEQSVEATAIEVERIGEGQRFVTRLFTEGQGAPALPARAPQEIPRGE